MRRRLTLISLALVASLIFAAPAGALRAQVGDPFRVFSPFSILFPFHWMGDGIGERMLWIAEEPRDDGRVEDNGLFVSPRADEALGADLFDQQLVLTPGLPLLLQNCGRLPFTSEQRLTCDGRLDTVYVALGPGSDFVVYELDVPGYLSGGEGSDRLVGGPAADQLNGDAGNDRLYGGGGADRLVDSNGADKLYGGTGPDMLLGGVITETKDVVGNPVDSSGDELYGEEGNDRLEAIGGDRLDGGPGDDSLSEYRPWVGEAAGADELLGGPGNDWLNGGLRSDSLDGGEGSDMLDGGLGADTIAGGPGVDTAQYLRTQPITGQASRASIFVTLDGVANDGEAGEGDLVRPDVENVLTSYGNDTLIGSAAANRLSSSAGNDYLSGLGGDDSLLGGSGDDSLFGGSGSDTLNGGSGNDVLNGGLGGNVLNGGDGDDDIEARNGVVDKISCGAGIDEARVDVIDIVAPGCERVIRAK